MERSLQVQKVFYKVLLEENEFINNEFDFLYCNNHSEDCVAFWLFVVVSCHQWTLRLGPRPRPTEDLTMNYDCLMFLVNAKPKNDHLH